MTQSSDDEMTANQDADDSSLAITGANLWAVITLSMVLALGGSGLLWWKHRTGQGPETARGSAWNT